LVRGRTSRRARGWHTISVAAIATLSAIAVSGCSNVASTTSNGLAAVKPARVTLSSSVVHDKKLPALYTCDGRNISPPLSWGAVPSNVGELVLFLLSTRRGTEGRPVLSIEWGLAGIKPGLHSLRAGEVPRGAFELTGSNGHKRYSICPPRGQAESYSFAVFALPADARATPHIPGPSLFSNLNDPTPQDESPAAGAFTVVYKRR
jgi:hypothetical protein